MGAPLQVSADGRTVTIDPGAWRAAGGELELPGGAIDVPGDPSSSAFLIAAALVAGADTVVCRRKYANPTRTGFLDALAAMGATIAVESPRQVGGEPVADLVVRGAAPTLRGVELGGDLVVRAIDEVPILAAVAARAHGTTVVRDAHELRVKESDRIATTAAPVSIAEALPRFTECRTTTAPASLATCWVASVEPSSTTSTRSTYGMAFAARTVEAIRRDSSFAGMTTATRCGFSDGGTATAPA